MSAKTRLGCIPPGAALLKTVARRIRSPRFSLRLSCVKLLALRLISLAIVVILILEWWVWGEFDFLVIVLDGDEGLMGLR